ncbi:MBL fold metallo-hydrolase [Allopusillimonas ginsengisoli]|uniref:MBL fold metallo-hydrolase n=1 Tax=Allopusillimonas ginsengisoli TaxID=453575 RepID=UPI0010C182B0|nr:MBL fold metallo-hydrolase [Allopusillimonas ginsengisoli]
MSSPLAQAFFDDETSTFSYVVYKADEPYCAIIDSVLNYDPKSGRTATDSADDIINFVQKNGLTAQWILETHAHADHLSAAAYLKRKLGGRTAIGQPICQVQKNFKEIFNLEDTFSTTGVQFDHLFAEGEGFNIGSMHTTVMHVPGHTPADMAYHVHDLGVFIGDTLFMPDVGTARCDFPDGDARQLYRSIKKLLTLDHDTRLFLCHDYPPETREAHYSCTVAEQRQHNIHVRDGVSEDEFVNLRTARDKTLEMPTLILPAIQINIRAGEMPPHEDNGVSYLKIPLNHL